MGTVPKEVPPRGAPPSGSVRLPPTMKVLYVATPGHSGEWLAEALAADRACDVHLHVAANAAGGIARLRDEAFDVVLVSHEPGLQDASAFLSAIRGGGCEDPVVVLGALAEAQVAASVFEAGGDGYLSIHTTTPRHLLWMMARAMQQAALVRENRRLIQAERARLQREHDETARILEQQRDVLEDLESLREGQCAARALASPPIHGNTLPHELLVHYRELLRTYVIMGSGSLSDDLAILVGLLVEAGLPPRMVMQLHLVVLEEIVRGLGTRSTRHVMTRADLLVLELMVHLAEAYRERLTGISAEEAASPATADSLSGG